MKKIFLIMVSVGLLLIFCVCNNRSVKVEESTQVNECAENQIIDSAKYVIPDSAFHQTTAKSIDKVLSEHFQDVLNRFPDDYRYTYPAFKKLLTHYLSSPVTFYNRLDTLETLITIQQSPDKKIKFYGWDDREGGSSRTYDSYIQYKGIGDTICYSFGGISDTFEIYEIVEDENTYYLTLSFIREGAGLLGNYIGLFKIDGNKLIWSDEIDHRYLCYNVGYEGARDKKWIVEYDNATKTLSFEDWDYGYEFTGKIETLKFSNGEFR